MAMNLTTHKEELTQWLKDPLNAQEYLKVALEEYEEDGDFRMFLKAIRNVAESQGKTIPALAEIAGMQPQSVYQALSDKGNPRTDSLFSLMHGIGYRFSVEPVEKRM